MDGQTSEVYAYCPFIFSLQWSYCVENSQHQVNGAFVENRYGSVVLIILLCCNKDYIILKQKMKGGVPAFLKQAETVMVFSRTLDRISVLDTDHADDTDLSVRLWISPFTP